MFRPGRKSLRDHPRPLEGECLPQTTEDPSPMSLSPKRRLEEGLHSSNLCLQGREAKQSSGSRGVWGGGECGSVGDLGVSQGWLGTQKRRKEVTQTTEKANCRDWTERR